MMSSHEYMPGSWPGYHAAYMEGTLSSRVQGSLGRLGSCDICPRECGVNRLMDEIGRCGIGRDAVVASYSPHFGEESPISGRKGSGTIFFSGCNLSCMFCQNHDISQNVIGRSVSARELSDMMLELQGFGCHNINLVSPSHIVPQILEALELAAMKGLDIPLVYNTGGYDSIGTLELLDGIIDVYMPDMKFSDPATGLKLCGVPDYPGRNREAVKVMHRQVGDLRLDDKGVALKGLLVRHLVLPEGLSGTLDTVGFLSENVSKDTYINVMAQYRPDHRAYEVDGLERMPTSSEIGEAYDMARRVGLHRFDRQRAS